MALEREVRKLRESAVAGTVSKRLAEFKALGEKGNNDWFSELCFCILTANSKAKTAMSIQEKLGAKGFLTLSEKQLAKEIRGQGHRFHNNKAHFIIVARKHSKIRDTLMHEKEPREWLVQNVKGLGWKESSHFLRNVGYEDYAILDRHILGLMCDDRICEKPRVLNKKNYFEIEGKLRAFAGKMRMTLAELDLYMFYLKTSEVLK